MIDFGKQAFGWLELEIHANTEVQAIARMGEDMLDGRVNRNPPGSVRYCEVTQRLHSGKNYYRFSPEPDERNTGPRAIPIPPELGVIMPFRYAELEIPEAVGAPVVLVSAVLRRVQYCFNDNAAEFACSNKTLEALWQLCHHTILATSFAGTYVDGDRERIPYEADAYINQLSHYAVDREFSLARRTHDYLMLHPTWPTEWKQHSILIAWADYEATGDKRLLRRHYGELKAKKLLLEYARPDGLLDTGILNDPEKVDSGDLVDWPVGERDCFDFRPVNTVVNAFHYRTLILMAKIAEALEEGRDSVRFLQEAEKVYRRFNKVFFNEEYQAYLDGDGSLHRSLHANLFALAFNLVPDHRQHGVLKYIKSRGMVCSVYPAQFLLEGLFEAGESEYAIGLMTGGGIRSWRNMLEHGATLTWEAWDQSLKPNQDWNHAWGAAPGNIIARYVLGVRPLEPGYGKVAVRPQWGNLDRVRGIVPTIRGPVFVEAWREGGLLQTVVKVPANMTLAETPGPPQN